MKENGFEYVDLGLPSGTMWATCNVGATKPEDEGLLFQFGRVDGYKYGDRNNKFVEDDLTTTSGKVYKETDVLDLDDDAAHVHMGGKWKMPTKDELKELLNNTTHKVEIINGVKGMLFTSNTNDNQLFIPFMKSFWYNGTWYSLVESYAFMWFSQVHTSYIDGAYRLYCDLGGSADFEYVYRAFAYSVRGVFKK